jgi:hypothetical protein
MKQQTRRRSTRPAKASKKRPAKRSANGKARKPPRIVSSISDVAKHFRLSTRWCSTWFKEKDAPKRADGKFDLVAIAKWREAEKAKASEAGEITEVRRLTLEMEAEHREIEYEIRRGRWILIATVNHIYECSVGEAKLCLENLADEVVGALARIRQRTVKAIHAAAERLIFETQATIADKLDRYADERCKKLPKVVLPEDTPAPKPTGKVTPQLRLARIDLEETRDKLRELRLSTTSVSLVREAFTESLRIARECLNRLPAKLAAAVRLKSRGAALLIAEAKRQVEKAIVANGRVFEMLDAELAA